jgi:hypothetical protein
MNHVKNRVSAALYSLTRRALATHFARSLLWGAVLVLLPLTTDAQTSPSSSDLKKIPPPALERYDVPAGQVFKKILTADFNGDKLPDLAAVSSDSRKLFLYLATGRFTFASPQQVSLPKKYRDIAALDVSGDGKADLLILTAETIIAKAAIVKQSQARFVSVAEYDAPENATAFYTQVRQEFSREIKRGKKRRTVREQVLHVFIASETGLLDELVFKFKSGFQKVQSGSIAGGISALLFPNDGLLQAGDARQFFAINASQNEMQIIGDTLGGSFKQVFRETILSAACADFNHNGLPDVAMLRSNPSLSQGAKTFIEILYDVGVGTGVAPIRIEGTGTPQSLLAADIDRNGFTDLIVFDGFNEVMTVYYAESAFAFSQRHQFGVASDMLALGSADGKTKNELLFTEKNGERLTILSSEPLVAKDIAKDAAKDAAKKEPPKKELTKKDADTEIGEDIPERLMTGREPSSLALSRLTNAAFLSSRKSESVFSYWKDKKLSNVHRSALALAAEKLWVRVSRLGEELLSVSSTPFELSLWNSTTGEKKASASLPVLDVANALSWTTDESASSLVATLDSTTTRGVPQLLFHNVSSGDVPVISELEPDPALEAGITEAIASLQGKRKKIFALLQRQNEKKLFVKLYELRQTDSKKLHIVGIQQKLLPAALSKKTGKQLFIRDFDGDEQYDFLLTSPAQSVVMMAANTYTPEPIDNFPKLSGDDRVFLIDADADGILDILISRAEQNALVLMRGKSPDAGKSDARKDIRFKEPELILRDVIASDVAVIKEGKTTVLLVANVKLNTLDRVKIEPAKTKN